MRAVWAGIGRSARGCLVCLVDSNASGDSGSNPKRAQFGPVDVCMQIFIKHLNNGTTRGTVGAQCNGGGGGGGAGVIGWKGVEEDWQQMIELVPVRVEVRVEDRVQIRAKDTTRSGLGLGESVQLA